MPLIYANAGETNTIKKISGKEDIKRFLENLGFVIGSDVTVISKMGDNIIVNMKESRVALSKEIAGRIMI